MIKLPTILPIRLLLRFSVDHCLIKLEQKTVPNLPRFWWADLRIPSWVQVEREEEDEVETRSLGISPGALRRRVTLGSQSLHVCPGVGKRWWPKCRGLSSYNLPIRMLPFLSLSLDGVRFMSAQKPSQWSKYVKEGLSWGRGINLSVISGEVGSSSGEGRQRREKPGRKDF